MANKALKTLTMGGVSFDVIDEDFVLDKIKDATSPTLSSVADNLSLSNNTDHFRTMVTANKDGIFIGRAYVNFTAKAGGWRYAYPAIYRNGSVLNLPGVKVDQPTNATTWICVPVIVNVKNGDAIRIYMRQTSGSTISTDKISMEGVILGNG